VECIEVKYHPVVSKLCHQVKNLYNRANFLIKNSLKRHNKLLFYSDLNSLLEQEECYRVLPFSHCPTHTQTSMQELEKVLPSKKKSGRRILISSSLCPPNYKAKDGELVAIFTNQQASIVNGWLVLPKKVGFNYKTRQTPLTKLREVRIVPRRVRYTIELVYLKTLPKTRKRPRRKEAIDLGMGQPCGLCG